MRRLYFIIFVLSFSLKAAASFNEYLNILQVSKDKKHFTFVRKDGPPPRYGITIKDPTTKQHLYDVKVLKCGPKTCLGLIKKDYSGLGLKADEKYLHSYNDEPTLATQGKVEKLKEINQGKSKKLPKEKSETLPQVSKAPTKNVYHAYLGYGTPVGGGLKVGFFRQVTGRAIIGPNLAQASSKTNTVSLKANIFSFMFAHDLWQVTKNFKFNFLGELGLAKIGLDFSEVDAQGPKEDTVTYLVGFGGEAKYSFKQFALAARGGLSKSGLKTSYESNGGSYNNPYSQLLTYVEFGFYYNF